MLICVLQIMRNARDKIYHYCAYYYKSSLNFNKANTGRAKAIYFTQIMDEMINKNVFSLYTYFRRCFITLISNLCANFLYSICNRYALLVNF
jgi:hypothetical protein